MSRLSLLAAATLASVAAAIVLAAPASGGVYTVYSCKTPDGTAGDAADWKVTPRYADTIRVSSACPVGNYSLELGSAITHASDDSLRATFWAPPDTTIQSYRLWRTAQLGPVYHWRYSELREGDWSGRTEFDICFQERGCSSLGRLDTPLSPANLVGATAAPNITGIDLFLTCGHEDAGGTACTASTPAARAQLHRADFVLEDRLAPTISPAPSGPLVEPGRLVSGVQPLTVAATDRGGGVYRARVEVDGAVIAQSVLDPNGGRCHEPFTSRLPCKLAARGTIPVNTAAVPDGPHALRVLVTDVTGTNVAAWGPVPLWTENNRCNPSPRVRTPRLLAGLSAGGARGAGRRRARLAVHYGRAVRLTGRLVGADGGVPGAAICVLVRNDMRGAATHAHTLMTRADGRFSYRLRRGASRRVALMHRVPGGAAVARVRVRVRAPVSLEASRTRLRNGEQVVLHGRLGGRPAAPRGMLVELQARRGKRWQNFGTARTGRGGRFRYAYRFTRTYGTQVYEVRARATRQLGYPFAAGASRPVRLRVSG